MHKDQFILPEDVIYMCGHSLGPCSKLAMNAVSKTMQDWSIDAVKAWNDKAWINLPFSIAAKIAPLIGADPSEVAVSDSTSVNLFKVLMSALRLNSNRNIILSTDDNFPADLYIAQGIAEFKNEVILKTVMAEKLIESLDDTIAVLMLTQVNYRDASVHDLAEITKYAHEHGILVVWDLSHSVGILPINLKESDADFAVGCTYKYLNGGPGAPSFIYVNARHSHNAQSPIYGWMGHKQPFIFASNYESSGAASYIAGTPYILSLKALEAALGIFEDIDITKIYEQSLQSLVVLEKGLKQYGLNICLPETKLRGGHLAFLHDQAYSLSRALIKHGVICDYREPNLIRLCVNPLYLNLGDIKLCLKIIGNILEKKIYLLPEYQIKLRVT